MYLPRSYFESQLAKCIHTIPLNVSCIWKLFFVFFPFFFLILIIIFVQRLELNVCSFHLESLVSMPHENTRGQHTEGHAVVKTHYVLRHQ